jgi:small nuclear ribonucleoprotein (snRNP)-like protein
MLTTVDIYVRDATVKMYKQYKNVILYLKQNSFRVLYAQIVVLSMRMSMYLLDTVYQKSKQKEKNHVYGIWSFII